MLKLKRQNLKDQFFVETSIIDHPAWHGKMSGFESELYLMKKGLHSYLLREGEKESHFYISYVSEEGSVKHQPFTIFYTEKGWFCIQGAGYGPFQTEGIDFLIHHLMHCAKGQSVPLRNINVAGFVASA